MNIDPKNLVESGVVTLITTLAMKPFKALAENMYITGYMIYGGIKENIEYNKRLKNDKRRAN